MKVCRVCKCEKKKGDFHRDKYTRDGRKGLCKVCTSEYNKRRRKGMCTKRGETIYALYKGDVYVMDGTAGNIADHLKVRPETIRVYATPTAKARAKNSKHTVERIGYENEMEELHYG